MSEVIKEKELSPVSKLYQGVTAEDHPCPNCFKLFHHNLLRAHSADCGVKISGDKRGG